MWKVPPLEISAEDRRELERLVRAHTTPQRQVRRARVVLLAAEGVPNRRIAAEVGMSEHNVGKWRHRFAVSGLAGLKDAPRPGRPPLYGHEERLRLVAKVTEEPPDPASHWSHSQLAVALSDIGISASQVGRILASLDIKPHRVRSWISRRNDPDFWERAADVCGLYVNPPENALVLSVDEKTAIPARNPTQPTEPVAPGQVERKESEYVRHGVAHLVAALDVHRGGIFHATDVSSNNSTNFCSFLADVDAKVPAELEIHLVLDNGSSKETRAWLEQHPRFHVHHTPNHASWLNMVELFFSILARRLLKRGEFTSLDDLVRKIMAFIEEYNRTAKPFRWTYGGKPLKVA